MRYRREQNGEWLYDDSVAKPVFVVSTDYDYWYEIAKSEDSLEPDEKPDLNEEGRLFYVCFKLPPNDEPIWPDSPGHKSIAKAVEFAESKVPGTIYWS